LVSKGCKLIHLGGSMHPFAPGLPVELAAHNIFIKSGFKQTGTTWDVAQDLKDYQPAVNPGLGQVRPLQPDQVEAMRLFLRHEFPDRWMFEFEESLRMGEGLTDFQVLWIDHAIQGMVNLTFENSHRPLDRFYMAGLPRPWGQLGTVGVSHALRGQGFGALIMDSGLRRLKDSGVRGCVIDWTGLLDFYAKFGFKPFREYLILVKDFHL
jgi:predicted N-acetyltransferase YhbS